MMKFRFFLSLFLSWCCLGQIPFPDGKPAFVNLPGFLSPSWNKNGNPGSGIYPFNITYAGYVSSGPAVRNYNPLPIRTRAQIYIDPPEFTQSNTNTFATLSFWYRFWPDDQTLAKVSLNNIFFCYLPSKINWTRFSTNINLTTVSKLAFEVSNDSFVSPKSPDLWIDAVQWIPIWSFPQNNNTNFVVTPLNETTVNVKWNSSIYPNGSTGFKLYGGENIALPLTLVTISPILSNNWFYVNVGSSNKAFYQLRSN